MSTCKLKTSQPNELLGGYCGGVPPLPIPNREVKPACADGTAMQCGRVGGRLLLQELRREIFGVLFFALRCWVMGDKCWVLGVDDVFECCIGLIRLIGSISLIRLNDCCLRYNNFLYFALIILCCILSSV